MSLQLLRIVLFLPFFFIGSTEDQEASSTLSYSVIQTPPFLNVSEGSDVTLNCKVEGNISSKWFVNWMKMGGKKKLENSNRIFVFKNETDKSSILTLKSAVVADSGIYHCEMGYLRVSKNGITNVTIWEKPNIAVNQTPQYASRKAGADVSITCSYSKVSKVSLMEVTWYKDSQELRNLKHSEKLKHKAILKLLNVDVKDSGNYVCVIRIGNRTGSGNGTYVQIAENPNIAVNQTPQYASRKAGADVSITCSYSKVSNVSLMEVTWYKDNQELRNLKHSEKLKQKAILKLLNVDVKDSGNYVCVIRIGNRTGSGNGTYVQIAAANLLVIQSPSSIQKTEGENLTMDCTVQGKETKHLHRVSWYKVGPDGQKSLMTHGTGVLKDRTSLFLRNIKQEDSGNYTCEVDSYGQGNGTRVTILGRGKPLQTANVDEDDGQPDPPPQIGIPVGVGVAVGTLAFLLLLGVLVWRSKRKNKGAAENPSEAETTVAKEAQKHTLTKRTSDVTYADIRFHKREAQPDTEVVYAEVRLGTKRPEHTD